MCPELWPNVTRIHPHWNVGTLNLSRGWQINNRPSPALTFKQTQIQAQSVSLRISINILSSSGENKADPHHLPLSKQATLLSLTLLAAFTGSILYVLLCFLPLTSHIQRVPVQRGLLDELDQSDSRTLHVQGLEIAYHLSFLAMWFTALAKNREC